MKESNWDHWFDEPARVQEIAKFERNLINAKAKALRVYSELWQKWMKAPDIHIRPQESAL